MSLLRRLSASRLLALCAGVVLLVGGGAAFAAAAFSGQGAVPPAKALAPAIRDVLAAKPVPGITARVTFTNHLIDSASVQGANPLLSGATGRLWLAPGGRARLELQSDGGDAQLVSDGQRFFVYDASSNTAYSGSLPRSSGKGKGREPAGGKERVPTVSEIERGLTRLMRRVAVLGPTPESTAGQPAYRVRVSPRHDGGLLGAAEISWDALHGVPLRAAVYAQGRSAPVLELKATQVSYGAVPASTFAVSPPAGAKIVQVNAPARGAPAGVRQGRDRHHGGKHREPQSVTAVSRSLPFRLSAPDRLVGLPRRRVRLLDWNRRAGALAFYGRGLGGIVVMERRAGPAAPAPRGRRGQQLDLPKVSINGATGTELATALGTVVQFERGGIAYTVLGSVPPAAAEAAARGL